MNFIVAAAAATASVQALTVEEMHIGRFNNWKQEHSKVYRSIEEETARFEVWMNNHNLIQEHNSDGDDVVVGHNEFSDLTSEEFAQRFNGFSVDLARRFPFRDSRIHRMSGETLPAEKDWQAEGAVTAVKNQGQCGACWAFATTGSVEGAYLIKHGGDATATQNILSEQQLVDCSTANMGCNGGAMEYAFEYLEKLGSSGDDTEASYKYQGKDLKCRAANGVPSMHQVLNYKSIPVGSEAALKDAVATQGPVAVSIQANQLAFQFYRSGVLKRRCGKQLDHGVLVVGYGMEDGQEFWKVKNSWGPSWGEEGYIRIAMGKDLCGISQGASYPIVA